MSDHFKIAARELIDRYGDRAVELAKERVELLKQSDERTELNMALMVLTEIEKFSR